MYTFYNDMDDTFYLLEQQKDGKFEVLERFRDLEYLQEEYGLFEGYARGSEYIYEFSLNLKEKLIPIGRYNTEEENKHSLTSFKIGAFWLDFYFREKPQKRRFDYRVPKIPSDDDDIIVEFSDDKYHYLTLKFSMLNEFLKKIKGISSKEILEKEFIFEEFYYEKERKEVCALIEVNSNKNLLKDFLKEYYGR